ncbi:MAG: alpha/beta fold hydrolase [Spirochaetales bacterium]|nr:alpha/beta fold hydrolase [Spirochaetales bacterium]
MKKIILVIAGCVLTLSMILFVLFIVGFGQEPANKEMTSPELHPLMIEALRSRSFPAQELAVVKNPGDKGLYQSFVVSYFADGLSVRALLNIPKYNMPPKGFPVVIVCHGHYDLKKYTTEKTYPAISSYFAEHGFIMLKPDYRGHGESQASEDPYLDRVAYPVDVLTLLAAVPTIKEADTENIFLWGHSMGGTVALTVLEVRPEIKAASLWGAVSVPFPESLMYFARKHSAQTAEERLRLICSYIKEKDFSKISPADHLYKITAPILIQHGTADELVPYEWSVTLNAKLAALGKVHEFVTWQNANHNLSGLQIKALDHDVVFFRKYLKK